MERLRKSEIEDGWSYSVCPPLFEIGFGGWNDWHDSRLAIRSRTPTTRTWQWT